MRVRSVVILSLLLSVVALAQSVPLPFDLVDNLDGVKFKIRVPANWNGTLLLFMRGSKPVAPPPEPLIVPVVMAGSDPPLEGTLLANGYALAASEVGNLEWQVKEEVQDTLALAAYFRGKVGNPKRVILWGSSLGGLTAVRALEDFPRSFDAGIAMCGALRGYSRRLDASLDFSLAYEAVFGWPVDQWGPPEDLRTGLDFFRDVYQQMVWPKPDESNRGALEFIRLVNGMSADGFWKNCPLNGAPGYFLSMYLATGVRQGAETGGAGPVARNAGRVYTLTSEEISYLAGLGVNAADLLAKMNARTNLVANPRARDYVERFGDVRGMLWRPLLTVHNTLDGMTDASHIGSYAASVASADLTRNLAQAYVAGVGHCAFTSRQVLLALAAIESWLDTGVKPDASFFPAAEGFDNSFKPAPWPRDRQP